MQILIYQLLVAFKNSPKTKEKIRDHILCISDEHSSRLRIFLLTRKRAKANSNIFMHNFNDRFCGRIMQIFLHRIFASDSYQMRMIEL
jgi:hypothetical protein